MPEASCFSDAALILLITQTWPPRKFPIEKKMVADASFFLFNATKRRFYFSEVKILIPNTWQPRNYGKPKHEVYDKASVIVANPNFNFGNDPYTLQYEGCGKEGKYIHFTPDFLTDDSLLPIYGPQGKVFVHEWAHLRWGVFDEYNYEEPFYVSVENQIKATRCSSEVSGMYVCKERSCTDGECMIDPQTGNLAEGCMFLVNSSQSSKASIMYMQALSSVVDFCDKNTHDQEAPNMQNQMCSYRSSWEIITDTHDYLSTLPMPADVYPPLPTFSILQARSRVLCLVLDVSSNMATGDRIHRLRQAAAIFLLHFVEEGSHVGIVTYNETAEIRSPLRHIDREDVRRNLTSSLPLSASGKACICKGIQAGLQMLSNLEGKGDGAEMILVSGGKDENMRACISNVLLSGSVIHTISIGHIPDSGLEHLAELTGGSSFVASGNMDSDNLIGAFTEMSPSYGDHTNELTKVLLVSRSIRAGCQLAGSVYIDGTLGNDTLFVVTWQGTELPSVVIEDPSGKTYTHGDLEHDTYSKIASINLPGTAKIGTWKYNIINTLNSSQVFDILVTSRPSSSIIPPITITAYTDTSRVTFPVPLAIFVEVKQGFSPVLGVNVTAVIEPELGDIIIVALLDNGAGADVVKDDGIYSRFVFSFNHSGQYSLKIHAQSTSNVSVHTPQYSRAMYVPGYIENGTIRMNPPKSVLSGEVVTFPEAFSRIIFVESFKVTKDSQDGVVDVFPPCRIIDLEARIENEFVVLFWTAPGDNYDQGTATSYDIRMSNEPSTLREHFYTGILINTSTLTPKNAGSREYFSFIPHRNGTANGSITYFGIRTRDKASLLSDISNLVQVTRPTELTNINYAHSQSTATCRTSTIIFIVVSIISGCLVLGASVYSFRKYSMSKLRYHSIRSSIRESYRSTKHVQTFPGSNEHEFPLRVLCDSGSFDVTALVVEEQVEV
uniref:VWFA domain-containing protein n=1 Tax=Leptobrachium leishanense TaxID=445787 RepID=A0A8C5R9X9_9ANUR